MNRQQVKDFIALNVEQQGDEGAINLSSLIYAIVDKLFADPQTGVSPIVVGISKEGVRDGSSTTYEIATPQDELNVYIDEAQTDNARTRLFVQDGDAVTNDGHYHLQLSSRAGQSYFVHDETTNGIAQVTESEIKAYKTQFGADYSKAENVFKITVGTTVINMSPADMMLIQEEYNKVSNDAFAGCGVLHTVKLRGVGVNIGFDDCKQLSKDSVKYLIENCDAANFTLTLNSLVYNELFGADYWADVKALLQTNITVKSVEA